MRFLRFPSLTVTDAEPQEGCQERAIYAVGVAFGTRLFGSLASVPYSHLCF